jgi:hypothetical protein
MPEGYKNAASHTPLREPRGGGLRKVPWRKLFRLAGKLPWRTTSSSPFGINPVTGPRLLVCIIALDSTDARTL